MAPALHPAKRRRTSESIDAVSSNRQKTAGPLHTFFHPATEEQRWLSYKLDQKSTEPGRDTPGDEVTEAIEDDYGSCDEIFTKHLPSWMTRDEAPQPLPCGPSRRPSPRTSNNTRKLTSKRFLINSTPNPPAPEARLGDMPWAQRFPPIDLFELAVHKKKVTDVRSWLELAFTGRDECGLLVLRGPAGCGKTTTVSLLSKSLRFDILEWKNPTDSSYGERAHTAVSAQFDEFLARSNKFGGLDLDNPGAEGVARSPRRILLIEEFPTVLGRSSHGLFAFRSSLRKYLAANISRTRPDSDEVSSPVVIIVSESHLNSSSSMFDNLTVHRLLGSDIFNHRATTIIDFNAIAPTFMHKALKLVLEKESRHSNRSKIPGTTVLENISEVGDIRSAIFSLEFLCLGDDETGIRGGNTLSRSKELQRTRKEFAMIETGTLKLITQREASLGIFHAVGKVVYNKRDDPSPDPNTAPLVQPPDHLSRHFRRKISQVAVNELIDEAGTDIQTFISALHENYVLSCDGPSFINSLNGCIDALSDSDVQCVRRRWSGSRRWAGISTANFAAGIDELRQLEMGYQVAVRGLLFSLPYPVNRSLPSVDGTRKVCGAHKMLFPSSIRLSQKSEEIDDLIDLWRIKLLRAHADRAKHSPMPLRSGQPRTAATGINDLTHGQDDYNDTQAIPVTMLHRDDIILHQLPYVAKIRHDNDVSAALEKITRFSYTSEGTSTDADGLNSPRNRTNPRLPCLPELGQESTVHGDGEKLILSDDDIED